MSGAVLIGFSTGGGEVARYIGRHGTKRVPRAALISAVPPLMLKRAANPGGLPIEAFDAIRAGVAADRSQFFKDVSAAFFGANRLVNQATQGMRDAFWFQGMQCGHKAALDCIKAFSETDFTEDLKLVKNAILKIYPGAPHGLTDTHKEQLGADLLEFLKA